MFSVTASSFRAADTSTKLNPIMKVNELNGATVGSAHRSDHACATIGERLPDEMRKKLISSVKSLDSHGCAHMII